MVDEFVTVATSIKEVKERKNNFNAFWCIKNQHFSPKISFLFDTNRMKFEILRPKSGEGKNSGDVDVSKLKLWLNHSGNKTDITTRGNVIKFTL